MELVYNLFILLSNLQFGYNNFSLLKNFSPKCRREYSQKNKPKRYACYCGKEEDPKFDPWLFPHSCGQTCEKLLKPECGHACLMLCHPGTTYVNATYS